jgi:hypothetical protein
MKGVLGGKRFRNNDEVIAAVQSWIYEQPKTFFETGIKKLSESWHKGMAINGDYIENQCVKLFHFVVNNVFRNKFSFKFERPSTLHSRILSISAIRKNFLSILLQILKAVLLLRFAIIC